MRLLLESGTVIREPRPEDYLSSINSERSFILQGSDGSYLQATSVSFPSVSEFRLAYYDADEERRFQNAGGPVSRLDVLEAFLAYREGDQSWYSRHFWREVFGSDPEDPYATPDEQDRATTGEDLNPETERRHQAPAERIGELDVPRLTSELLQTNRFRGDPEGAAEAAKDGLFAANWIGNHTETIKRAAGQNDPPEFYLMQELLKIPEAAKHLEIVNRLLLVLEGERAEPTYRALQFEELDAHTKSREAWGCLILGIVTAVVVATGGWGLLVVVPALLWIGAQQRRLK